MEALLTHASYKISIMQFLHIEESEDDEREFYPSGTVFMMREADEIEDWLILK